MENPTSATTIEADVHSPSVPEKIPMPDMETLTAAAEEVAAIRARHDGVHTIHGIYCAMLGYKQFVEAGIWSLTLQEGFESQLVRARCIDRSGFDCR